MLSRYIPRSSLSTNLYPDRPLREAELETLRTQYEKEGEMAGIQTKFNYAWVRLPGLLAKEMSASNDNLLIVCDRA